MKDGEKILPASDIESFRKMTATVLRHQQNEYGEQQLDIRPDDGRRELTLQPEYVITQSNSATAPPLWSFKPGTRIGFSYEGLNYSGFPGKIEEYYQLKAVD